MKNMLRYKTKTRPGLVALYNIRPGNGAGPFLQPRSPHGANGCMVWTHSFRHQGRTQAKNPLLIGVTFICDNTAGEWTIKHHHNCHC